MHKVTLQFFADTEEYAEKIRGALCMHTKHVKIVKQQRAEGVYGIIDIWIVMGGFILKENAKIAEKAINERFFN